MRSNDNAMRTNHNTMRTNHNTMRTNDNTMRSIDNAGQLWRRIRSRSCVVGSAVAGFLVVAGQELLALPAHLP